ncbi:MAG TPA: GDP-mannose 4,6-dehydratase [Bdellovibrionota bacterium]|nr:GDP-mannose 4,6-dehydratase [Bdellovibrionota bacterium]
MKGKTILITGGAGFIGTHLSALLYRDNRVRILDNFFRDAISNTELSKQPNIEIRKGDVCDRATVESAMDGVTHIVHLASIAGVDTVLKQPARTMETAILGTYNVLEEARARKKAIERLIDFSTSEVFGVYAYKVGEGNVTSLGAVGEARWTYAVSKLATEHLAHNYWKDYGTPTCSIRPFNIFGPNQIGLGAVHEFVVRAIRNEELTVHNDGDQIRSWCYVDDILQGILLCLTRKEAVGEAFNIGNPKNTLTIYHLAKEVIRAAKSSSKIVQKKWTEADVELRIPNISKARQLLGYEPEFDMESGLARTIDWYRSHM